MKVDIIYFTYNRLNDTLESTTYPFDLTVVDNGSSDDTSIKEYLKLIMKNIKYLLYNNWGW